MNILESAISIELDAEKYYEQQAEVNKENSLKNIFIMLAADEKKHAEILQDKVNKISYQLKNSETLPEAKTIFKGAQNIKSEISQIPSQLEVYRAVLIKEKESIDIYKKLLSESKESDDKKLFKFLVNQEEEHYAIIDYLISIIKNSEEWVESAEFGLVKEY